MLLRNDVRIALQVLVLFALFLLVNESFASTAVPGVGTGLPWEGPIDKVANSISGPYAFGVSLLGIVAAGSTMIWGGEIGVFLKTLIYVIGVISLIVCSKNLLMGGLFTGAVLV